MQDVGVKEPTVESTPAADGGAGSLSVFSVPGMDCPTEAAMVRTALGKAPEVRAVEIDLKLRQVAVTHSGKPEAVRVKLAGLGFGAELLRVSAVAELAAVPAVDAASEKAVLLVVLVINALMFVVELGAGILAGSTGLLADSLDMLADAQAGG